MYKKTEIPCNLSWLKNVQFLNVYNVLLCFYSLIDHVKRYKCIKFK